MWCSGRWCLYVFTIASTLSQPDEPYLHRKELHTETTSVIMIHSGSSASDLRQLMTSTASLHDTRQARLKSTVARRKV